MGQTVTTDLYSQQLQRVPQTLHQKEPVLVNGKGVLLYDYARPHVARVARNMIPRLGEVISYFECLDYARSYFEQDDECELAKLMSRAETFLKLSCFSKEFRTKYVGHAECFQRINITIECDKYALHRMQLYDVATPDSKLPEHSIKGVRKCMTATAGSDVVQSGRPTFDDFFQHLRPYIGNNTANVVFQMVKHLWFYPHRPMTLHSPTENSLAVLNHKILEANSQVQNVKLGGHQTCLSINRL
ncbi:uncharacterized protein TNCV_854131 [Trichonephila clavipes]|nr:uncharacterized protein TNCV_854131 [Trichonephila clavipes]